MVVGFTTICAISAYHHWSCEFEPHWWRGVHNTTLCDKVCQWPATCQWFSPGTPVSSTNKTDHHDITEILLKVTLNTINRTKPYVLTEYHHRNKKIVNHLGISSYINTHYTYIQTEVTKVIQTNVLLVSQTHNYDTRPYI